MQLSACIVSVSGVELTSDEASFLREFKPWGVILMGRSCKGRDQVRTLVADIHEALGREALIFIDQEGGRVARLKPPIWPAFPPAQIFGDLYAHTRSAGLEACRLSYRLIAHELSQMGITADCAPVCDLRQVETHDSIGDRAFSSDPDAVSALAGAALDGLAAGGVLGCIKHMPGQGRAVSDSHYNLPEIEAGEGDLETDFSIFASLANRAPMGMTGHVAYSRLDPGVPATLSAKIVSGIIRERIGFDNLLMTDDLGMDALGGDLADRGQRARAAGCDVLLHCSGFLSDPNAILSEMKEVAAAAGPLEGASLDRAKRAESALGARDGTDIGLARERLDALLATMGALS